jgi:diadenosine tetraphosphate (Ap4A) HIT family hydrolase
MVESAAVDSLDTPMNDTAIHRMVAACRSNNYPALIAHLPSGWAVMGAAQFLHGYCLLLPDPVVPHLNAMQPSHREQFLHDTATLGDAVLAVTGALRINYAMFGNAEPALHAHVIPRYADEAPEMRQAHPWVYDWSAAPAFDLQVHGELLLRLREVLG